MTDKHSSTVVVPNAKRYECELPVFESGGMTSETTQMVKASDYDELRAILAAPVEQQGEPVAKVVSKFGDPEAFGEREVIVLADLSKIPYDTPLYRHAQLPAKAGPWEPLSAPGQIKPGDWLHFTVGGKFICTKAKEILEAGTHREEVVYNRSRNHYFITGMAIDGTSSHKAVMVAKP